MMTHRSSLRHCLGLCLALFAAGGFAAGAIAESIKLQATLVWGTNDKDPNLQAVPPALIKKLESFKWKYYYEIERKDITAGKDETRVQMSKDCVLVVKVVGDGQVEVTLIGKGKTVGTIQKQLRKGGCLVTGGNASNSTGWFIIMKRIE
jgi:hypothetical protein